MSGIKFWKGDFLVHRYPYTLTFIWDENFFSWNRLKRFLGVLLIRSNSHFWNQYEKTYFWYPIRHIWRIKFHLLEGTKNTFWDLKGQNARNRLIFRKTVFYEQVLTMSYALSLLFRLLFRHFSQRQEVLRSFRQVISHKYFIFLFLPFLLKFSICLYQVQLLVSDSDVKSYKQIKDDLG